MGNPRGSGVGALRGPGLGCLFGTPVPLGHNPQYPWVRNAPEQWLDISCTVVCHPIICLPTDQFLPHYIHCIPITMLSKRVLRPTEKAQAIHEDRQHKCTANDADTTSEQNKRSRIEMSVKAKVSPQSSFNSTTNSNSTPWPTDHESASAMEATLMFSERDHT